MREPDQSPIVDVIVIGVRKRENEVKEKGKGDDREDDEQCWREEDGNEEAGAKVQGRRIVP